ncbi:hypothetical protein LXL04_010720 [Taraxacum kok-saghyz]
MKGNRKSNDRNRYCGSVVRLIMGDGSRCIKRHRAEVGIPRVGGKIEIESIRFKSRSGIDGIGMEAVLIRIRDAIGIDWSRVWDRNQKSVRRTNRSDFPAIGNADRAWLHKSGNYA